MATPTTTTTKENTEALVRFADLRSGLAGLFQYVLRRWYILLISGVVGALAGIMYATFQQPRYASNVTFALEENNGNMNGAFNLAAELGLSLGSGSGNLFTGENILQVLTSRRIIEAVLLSVDSSGPQKITLADRYLAMGAKGKATTIQFPVTLPRAKYTYQQDSILYTVYQSIVNGDLTIGKPDKRATIFALSFTSADEKFTQLFSERILEMTTVFYTELRTKRSLETIEILEQRLSELKGGLYTAFSDQAASRDANVNPAFSSANVPLQKQQFNVGIYGSAYTELYKNLEIARYQYLQQKPLVQIIDGPALPMKKIKTGRLFAGLAGACLLGCISLLALLWAKMKPVKNEG